MHVLVYCSAPLTSMPVTIAPTVVLFDCMVSSAASASAERYRLVGVRGTYTDPPPDAEVAFACGAVAMNDRSSRGRWYGRRT